MMPGQISSTYDEPSVSWFAKATLLWRAHAVTVLVVVFAVSFAVSTAGIDGRSSYYPRFLLIVVFVAAALDAVSTMRGRAAATDDSYVPPRGPREVLIRNKRTLLTVVCLLAYWFLIPILGFYATSLIFLLAAFMALDVRIRVIVVLAPVLLVMFYFAFTVFLGISLPIGIWI
jgi:hypothetical protein